MLNVKDVEKVAMCTGIAVDAAAITVDTQSAIGNTMYRRIALVITTNGPTLQPWQRSELAMD